MTLWTMMIQLGAGMMRSMGIFALTLLFALPLGLLVMFGRTSKNAVVRTVVKVYISMMRGTPLMLQLIAVYFGPYLVFRIQISAEYRFYAVIIAFVINYAAYFAEIYRSGIQAVPAGQREAAGVLGYSRSQIFLKIILPQMVKNVLPSVTNEVITLVKDTSLAYAIAYSEMFSIAKQMVAADGMIAALLVAGIYYYVFNLLVALGMEKLEKEMNYYH